MSSPKPVIGWCTACWESITSPAFDWLCSYAWPCLIHTNPIVSSTFNLIITFVWSLADNTSQSDQELLCLTPLAVLGWLVEVKRHKMAKTKDQVITQFTNLIKHMK